MKPRRRRPLSSPRKLLFAVTALVILLLGVELSMRLVYWAKDDLPPSPDDSQVYEWKWARDHLSAGTAKLEGPYDFDPIVGWRLRPNLKLELIRSNSAGFRAERDYPPGRQAGVKRLMLLGDSFTFGAFVDNSETYAHYLESEELPQGWEVLNLANEGHGPGQILLAYETWGLPYEPDVVAFGFFVRDYERSTLSFKSYQKPVFVPEGADLRLATPALIPPQELYEQYLRGERTVGVGWTRSYLALQVSRGLERLRRKRVTSEALEWQILSRIMRRFRDQARAAGSAPVWLVIPYRDVTEGPSKWQAIEVLCEQEAKKLGLPCLRLDDSFRAHALAKPDQPLYRPRKVGGHLSLSGNRVVAQALAKFLRERGLIAPE